MVGCCMPNCNSSNDNFLQPGIHFYKFPTETNRRCAWINAVGRSGFMPTEISVICSKHFKESDFVLKDDAVPFSTPEHLSNSPVKLVYRREESTNYFIPEDSQSQEKKICRISNAVPPDTLKCKELKKPSKARTVEDNSHKVSQDPLAFLSNFPGFSTVQESSSSSSRVVYQCNQSTFNYLSTYPLIQKDSSAVDEEETLITTKIKKEMNLGMYNNEFTGSQVSEMDTLNGDNLHEYDDSSSTLAHQQNLTAYNDELGFDKGFDPSGISSQQQEGIIYEDEMHVDKDEIKLYKVLVKQKNQTGSDLYEFKFIDIETIRKNRLAVDYEKTLNIPKIKKEIDSDILNDEVAGSIIGEINTISSDSPLEYDDPLRNEDGSELEVVQVSILTFDGEETLSTMKIKQEINLDVYNNEFSGSDISQTKILNSNSLLENSDSTRTLHQRRTLRMCHDKIVVKIPLYKIKLHQTQLKQENQGDSDRKTSEINNMETMHNLETLYSQMYKEMELTASGKKKKKKDKPDKPSKTEKVESKAEVDKVESKVNKNEFKIEKSETSKEVKSSPKPFVESPKGLNKLRNLKRISLDKESKPAEIYEDVKMDPEPLTPLAKKPRPDGPETDKIYQKKFRATDEDIPQVPVDPNNLQSILSHGKRRGRKKRVKWVDDSHIKEVFYFEVDDTERGTKRCFRRDRG